MRRALMILVVLAAAVVAGCGNVHVTGDAETCLLSSTQDAYTAYLRLDGNTAPAWVKDYLGENYKQWRYFVRSDKADANWGSRLPEEK